MLATPTKSALIFIQGSLEALGIRRMGGPSIEEPYILCSEEVAKIGDSILKFRISGSCFAQFDRGNVAAL
jgi:hypothetical protein